MAKGEITFYFDTLADLRTQLEETLGLGGERTSTPNATDSAQIGKPDPLYPVAEPDETEQAPEMVRGVLGKLGDGMTHLPAVETAAQPLAKEEPVVTQQEPAKESAPQTQQEQVPENSEGTKADVTLENLSGVPYEALLAFCEQNPGVGINVAKCGAAFFRPMVEHKVKSFLTTPAS